MTKTEENFAVLHALTNLKKEGATHVFYNGKTVWSGTYDSPVAGPFTSVWWDKANNVETARRLVSSWRSRCDSEATLDAFNAEMRYA